VSWRARIAALLGISAYALAPSDVPSLGDPTVDAIREAFGGQLQPPPLSQTRWYLAHVEAAELQADAGIIAGAARLMRAARKDGVLSGVLSTRTAGLVRLPKRFRGRTDMVDALQVGGTNARSAFDEMFPASELALLAADAELLGVAVGELVPVAGRAYPVLVRLDPEFLVYRWNENRWYFRSIAGLLPITPGDGKWILHIPGGRNAPWQTGLWRAVGRAFIRKEHASLHRDNWQSKLANPARVAVAPQGASETQKQSWFQKVMAWGVNTVFGLTPGYDVKLLESNGKGADSFNDTIEDSNNEIIIAVAGQTVTTDGGAGFQNSDIHKSIRADLIKATAEGLAYTINTQGLPAWVETVWLPPDATDEEIDAALAESPTVEWDVAPPRDRKVEADALLALGNAITAWRSALAGTGQDVDVTMIAAHFGIPLTDAIPTATAAAALPQPGEGKGALPAPAARRRRHLTAVAG
jgi:hypothetical protein